MLKVSSSAMSLKIAFLALLGATLTLAYGPWPNPASPQDINLGNLVIRDIFIVDDSQLQVQIWDAHVRRVINILQTGKTNAIERAAPGQIENVARAWIEIEGMRYRALDEERTIIDSLRTEALAKAPLEWNQAIQMSIRLFSSFRNAALSGDVEATRVTIVQLLNSIRQLNINIRIIISSRQ